MNTSFSFDQVGNKMPYTIPDNFFLTMQQNVKNALQEQQPIAKHRSFMLIVKQVFAVAACAALVALINWGIPRTVSQPVSEQQVEQAFNQLSEGDQKYMLTMYQTDYYLNEEMLDTDY